VSSFAWMIPGLVAGYIAGKIVNSRGEGVIHGILSGVVGALAGGWLFYMFGAAGVSGLSLYGLFVAVPGSVALLSLSPRQPARKLVEQAEVAAQGAEFSFAAVSRQEATRPHVLRRLA